jgi:hypothetical protein
MAHPHDAARSIRISKGKQPEPAAASATRRQPWPRLHSMVKIDATCVKAACLPRATGARQGAPICRNGQMKAYAPLLCLIIWTAPCFAQTKQSAPLSIQPETKQSAPLSIQPGTTMLTLNKMCQENANTRSYAVCMAYLRGLFDGMQQAKIVEDTRSTFCPPQTPDLDQIRLIIEQWVRDNPKNAGVSVGWAGPLALSLAFPCR